MPWAMDSVCSDTVNGWLWYCDEHDTQGNSDSQEEAEAMREAHIDFYLDDEDDDPCEVIVWCRTPHERA